MRKVLLLIFCLSAANYFHAQTHEYVDLGLPSGNRWATMNVGADSVRGVGAFFSYGDVTPDYVVPGKKTGYERSFDWANYKWAMQDEGGSSYSLTKYCSNPISGYKDFTDSLDTLLPEDDAATAMWGANWRTPTLDEYIELMENTVHEIVTEGGVFGLRLTSRVIGYEDRSIFFPYVGMRKDTDWKDMEDAVIPSYMTATSENKFCDVFAFPDQQGVYIHVVYRYVGSNVRAIYDDAQDHHPTVDLGLNVLWSGANIDATAFDERGGYFAWGSTYYSSTFDVNWDSYPYGTEDNLTKYNTKAECGVVDDKTELEPEDDPAKVLWGSDWRMPDTTDWKELVEKCTWEWVDTLRTPGYMITGKVPGYEGVRMFLPAVGFKEENVINYPYTDFYYYTSHLDVNNPNKAISVYFSDESPLTIESNFRYYGFACRPVKNKKGTGLVKTAGTMPQAAAVKIMREGQVLILREGNQYNVLGTPTSGL